MGEECSCAIWKVNSIQSRRFCYIAQPQQTGEVRSIEEALVWVIVALKPGENKKNLLLSMIYLLDVQNVIWKQLSAVDKSYVPERYTICSFSTSYVTRARCDRVWPCGGRRADDRKMQLLCWTCAADVVTVRSDKTPHCCCHGERKLECSRSVQQPLLFHLSVVVVRYLQSATPSLFRHIFDRFIQN